MTDQNIPHDEPQDDIDAEAQRLVEDARAQDESAESAQQADMPDVTAEGAPAFADDEAAGQADADDTHPDTLLAAERLEDLRRAHADHLNYRNRMERERAKDKDATIATVVEALIPVLDDVHMAREHGELTDGPFAAIAAKLEGTLERFGVQQVGTVGEVFDPTRHEALMHTQAELPEGTTETTVVQVLQPGFMVGERIVRAARVAVADPA